MKVLNVVCGIIYFENRIFITRRKEGKYFAGKWEFPVGKIGANESEKVALNRELLEELRMQVVVGKKLGSNTHRYEIFYKFNCLSVCFYCGLLPHD